MDRRNKLDLGLLGDVGETIRGLLPMIEAKSDRSFLDAMLRKHREAMRRLNVYVDHVGEQAPMHLCIAGSLPNASYRMVICAWS